MNCHPWALLLASATIVSGCTSIKYGDKETEAELKKFQPVPDKVSLYVCREPALLVAAGVKTEIFVDDEPIGTLKPNMFAHAVVSPGKRYIFLRKYGIGTGNSGVLSVDSKPGEVTFVWAGMTAGGFGVLTVDFFDNTNAAMRCVKGATYSVKPD